MVFIFSAEQHKALLPLYLRTSVAVTIGIVSLFTINDVIGSRRSERTWGTQIQIDVCRLCWPLSGCGVGGIGNVVAPFGGGNCAIPADRDCTQKLICVPSVSLSFLTYIMYLPRYIACFSGLNQNCQLSSDRHHQVVD